MTSSGSSLVAQQVARDCSVIHNLISAQDYSQAILVADQSIISALKKAARKSMKKSKKGKKSPSVKVNVDSVYDSSIDTSDNPTFQMFQVLFSPVLIKF